MACSMCGLEGVEGTCSMCYGDPYHNTDGEYLKYLEALALQEEIHRQLKDEIEEGLKAEADYQAYYDDDEAVQS